MDGGEHTLRTGAPAFDAVFANPFYEYLARNPEVDRRWAEWNKASASTQLSPLLDLCRIPDTGLLVDVGGGRGVFLSEILRARPQLRAVLLDSSSAVVAARVPEDAPCADDRTILTAGNFFDALPPGGDVCLLSRVVYNLGDEDAVASLRRCREAMHSDARVLIVESIMPPPDHPRRRNAAMGDLQMLLLLGAATRELGEHEALLDAAGLRLADVRSPDGYGAVIEAVSAP